MFMCGWLGGHRRHLCVWIVAPCLRWQVQATEPEIIDESSGHEDDYVGIWKQLMIEATAMAVFHNVEVMNEDCDSHVQFLFRIGRNRFWVSPLSDRQSVKYQRLQDKMKASKWSSLELCAEIVEARQTRCSCFHGLQPHGNTGKDAHARRSGILCSLQLALSCFSVR